MNLYKDIWYPKKKIEVPNRNIVDILTMEDRSAIRIGYYDDEMERQDSEEFAINYAWGRGDRSPVLRVFNMMTNFMKLIHQIKFYYYNLLLDNCFMTKIKLKEMNLSLKEL